MSNISGQEEKTFEPRARLLLQLGDQLIKNESIAITELVKNSYDADANVVNITMQKVDNLDDGTIVIEDDGHGMPSKTVGGAWLEPGSDFKTQQINDLKVSDKYGRLPIGEKGIGRFGVHKLGNVIEMTTKAKGHREVFVKIDWREFERKKYLKDVDIVIIERKRPEVFIGKKTGTHIKISSLRKKWTRGMARDVKRSLTALTSPFDTDDSFKPSIHISDKPGWLEGLMTWGDIKDYALFDFDITLSEHQIQDFSYNFTPWDTMSKLRFRNVTKEEPLVAHAKTLKFTKEYDHLKDTLIKLSKNKIGKVRFRGYIFDRDGFIMKMGVSDKAGFKGYLDLNGGIRVFRDGLRVYDYGEPENDWLGLDYRRFQQPSKRISNNIIVGAISLDRKKSQGLKEKTNREGFIEDEHYHAFRGAILHCIELIETLRQTDKENLKEHYGPTPKSSPLISTLGDAKEFVENKVKDNEIKRAILRYFNKIEADYKLLNENLLKAAGAGLTMSVIVHEVEKIIYEVNKVLKKEKASERVLKLVEHLSSLIDGYAEIIRRSSKTKESLIAIIDQSLFNTEYRLESHKVEVVKSYKAYQGQQRIDIAKNLLIGSIINIIDNSIYWLEQKAIKAKEDKQNFQKKILIDLTEDENFIHLIMADNGTGFLIPTDNVTEPFISAKPGGIGLGLHIASEIMEAQRGRLLFPEYGDLEVPQEFKNGAVLAFQFKK